MINEHTIILAVLGCIGVLGSAVILLRANHITSKYYNNNN